MAKKDAIKRDKKNYDGELRRWLEVRLDPEYRKFFTSYAKQFLRRANTPSGKIWLLAQKVATSEKIYDQHNEAFKMCTRKWGLIKPIDYRELNPTGRIFSDGPAQLAHPFLYIKSPVVLFSVNLTFKNSEIVDAISHELTKLRKDINRSDLGYKPIDPKNFPRIVQEDERRSSVDELIIWSQIYEMRYLSNKQFKFREIADRLQKKYPAKDFDENSVNKSLKAFIKHYPGLKR